VIEGRSFSGINLADELGDGAHDFAGCSFQGAVLDEGEWCGSTFEACDLTGMRITEVDLAEARFTGCTGGGAIFADCDLTDAVFDGCNFDAVRFASVVAAQGAWRNCKMLNATFVDVRGFGFEFVSCVLMYADLRGLSFRKLTLTELDLTESEPDRERPPRLRLPRDELRTNAVDPREPQGRRLHGDRSARSRSRPPVLARDAACARRCNRFAPPGQSDRERSAST
jgi:uncharacterized protein YjbI with pentapeptide repeats